MSIGFSSSGTLPNYYNGLTPDKKFRIGAQHVMWHNPLRSDGENNIGLRWEVGANYIGSAFYITIRVDDKMMKENGYHINNLKRFIQDLPVTVPGVCDAVHVWENEFAWLDPAQTGEPRRISAQLSALLQDMLTNVEMLIHTCAHPEAQSKALLWLQSLSIKYPNNLPQPKKWTLSHNETLSHSPEEKKVSQKKKTTPAPPFDPSVIQQNALNDQNNNNRDSSFLMGLISDYGYST